MGVLLAMVAGCDDHEPAGPAAADATRHTRCEVGERPRYFVPGGDDGPLAIIGCARLGASGRPVEFSVNSERIARWAHVCVNPAYRGRGQLGIYIPARCTTNPVPASLDVGSADVPDQAVRGYQLVLWGTADASIRTVVARHGLGETAAAVFAVGPRLARTVGAKRPFSVFVVELSPEAACERILVRANGPSGPATDRTRARPKHCNADAVLD